MAKPISFDQFHFRTKKSATEECRRRIAQYQKGDSLSLEDQHFFEALFTLHSEYESKKGVGIEYIAVDLDFAGNKCLFIHRIDGSKIDCSWVHCIQPASRKQIVSMAFRRAVKERVKNYKNEQLKHVCACPILGIPLSSGNSHVSYDEPSFDMLLSNFLASKNMEYDDVAITNPLPSDNDQRGKLSSIDLLDEWNQLHQEYASLQLISADANIRKKRAS